MAHGIDSSAASVAVGVLREALTIAVRQNSHDMLMTGEELRQCEAALSSTAGATVMEAGSEKTRLPEKARAGIEVLHRVVESLLTTSRYVDEEGEATMALADLSDCIAEPPFRLAAPVPAAVMEAAAAVPAATQPLGDVQCWEQGKPDSIDRAMAAVPAEGGGEATLIVQAIAMVQAKDLGKWSDAHDRVTLAALRAYGAKEADRA